MINQNIYCYTYIKRALILPITLSISFCFSCAPATQLKTAASFPAPWTQGHLEIHHINVKQADSTLIISPSGKTLLVDLGEPRGQGNNNANRVAEYIRHVIGQTRIDYLVITHFDGDHVGTVGEGGIWYLLEEAGFTIGKTLHRNYKIYIGRAPEVLDAWKEYLAEKGKEKLHPVIARTGFDQIKLGDNVKVKIIIVDANGKLTTNKPSTSENYYSLGFKLSYGKYDEWFGGDLPGERISNNGQSFSLEEDIAHQVGDVEVYRVHHHGSNGSSFSSFLQVLKPEVSIISVGPNSYHHPGSETISRLLNYGTVYMTGMGVYSGNDDNVHVEGDVVISTTNGERFTVNNTRSMPAY